MRWLSFGKKHEDDAWLVDRYKTQRDMDALGELFERYVHLVYGVCLKYLKDRSEAQDATMAIFEYLTERLPTTEVTYFKSWLYVVTKNHCLMKMRKEKNNPEERMELSLEMHLVEDDLPLHDEMQQSLLRKCMESLAALQQQCVQLFYMEQMSYKDIEAATAYSYNEIKSHIQNGKRNLKKCMEQQHHEQ